MTDDFTYKPQDVNYLGFLEAQLRDLQGIDTLAYELIQNADDARDENGRSHTTRISFDVTDDALIVANDGRFRDRDFARLQSIASGDKREEAGTTGAFGIGFVSVYQVTDAPEIFSNNTHWIIRPDAPPAQRIEERRLETVGTRFRLPWAFDERSPVRRKLRIDAIRREQFDAFATLLAQAIETAALFLHRLRVLEVRRNGAVVRRLARSDDGDGRLVLHDEAGHELVWLLFKGDFAAAARELRAQFPWQIEEKRRSDVRLALPVTKTIERGRLFAVLPTDSTAPLPFHVNADFFPTTDRKRIHFDDGYQSAWNEAALQAAARTVARTFAGLPAALGPQRLWQLLHQIEVTQQMAVQGDLPAPFAAFWQELEPVLAGESIAFTVHGEWCRPAQARVYHGADAAAVSLLRSLQIPLVDPALAAHHELMRRPPIEIPALTIKDLTKALTRNGLVQPVPLHDAPSFLRPPDRLQALWQLIDDLLQELTRPSAREAALAALAQCPLALTEMMALERPSRAYRGRPEAKALFPEVAWVHDLVPERRFPGRLVSGFGVRQAVDLFAAMPVEQLEKAWRIGRLDIPGLFRWFEAEQIEIFADDPALRHEIRRLPLCPVAGELRPLADLYIPGNFDDPLQLAGLVDLEAVGGRRQFLRDLGVSELDFDTYVHAQIPRVLAQNPDLPADGRQRLVQLLAERLGEIRDDELLQEQLGRLPLIACMDGIFRAAAGVYASREVMTLLGEQVHVAEPVNTAAVAALHRWLGVRVEPAAADLIAALLDAGREYGAKGESLPLPACERIWRCWRELDARLEVGELEDELLVQLQEQPVIPNQICALLPPSHVLIADRPQLAARFAELVDQLLDPDVVPTAVLVAAGVRSLSRTVALHRVDSEAVVSDEMIETRIRQRIPQIERVVEAEGSPESALQMLARLRVWRATRHQFQYRLQLGEQTWQTEPESVPVRLITETAALYVAYEGAQVPWTAVARELAAALLPDRPAAALALGIKEVLTAESATAASQFLDELGYP